MNKSFASIIVLVVIAGVGLFVGSKISFNSSLKGAGGLSANSCVVSSTVVKTLGHQLATSIVSAASNRAWIRIEQPINATNTVSLSFGGTAVAGRGLSLTPATTTSPNLYIDLGLNTDFPYVGAISAISNTGSTTVTVTDCVYN